MGETYFDVTWHVRIYEEKEQYSSLRQVDEDHDLIADATEGMASLSTDMSY